MLSGTVFEFKDDEATPFVLAGKEYVAEIVNEHFPDHASHYNTTFQDRRPHAHVGDRRCGPGRQEEVPRLIYMIGNQAGNKFNSV